jgi:hypothetical protein
MFYLPLAVLIFLCCLSLIVYRELFSKKAMTILHAVIPAVVSFMIFVFGTRSRFMFSPWIYTSWFFALYDSFFIYFILMIPMFFSAVYLYDRRKVWSAMIFPVALTIFMFVWLRGYLFYEMGWLVFYMMLAYLAWGLFCTLVSRRIWAGYVKIRDKLSGRVLFYVISGFLAVTFVMVVCVTAFTIAANTGKNEADYMPPPVTTNPVSAD